MHEVSIAHTLMHTLERSAREAGLERVTSLNVALGADAGVAPEALSFALQLATTGTLAENASVILSGPGAAPRAADHERHQSGHHDHDHDHGQDDDALRGLVERGSIRLAWIEGT